MGYHPFDQPAKLFVFRAGSVDGKSVAHQVGGGARAGEAGLFWKGAVSNDKQSVKVLMDTYLSGIPPKEGNCQKDF